MGTMLSSKLQTRLAIFWSLAIILLFSACSSTPSTEVVPSSTVDTETATSIPVEPTAIPEPAAAVVNDERIPLAWFESEVARYVIAQDEGQQPVEAFVAEEIVLQDLIDQVLLAQAAREAGAEISDQALQDKLNDLSETVDLPGWMAKWGYTEAELRYALHLQMLAAVQRNRIAESIPEVAEQVELRQVFAYTDAGAKDALLSLNSGRDFIEVAFIYDPVTGGYLGWVPRGYLLIPALEEAAFNLEITGYSEIIESDIGYHIVQVIDRAERPLSSDARLTLQRQALYDWLAEQREISTIEVLID
jgi:peptidyl-prolyl cis-trans isomerase C